MSNDKDLLILLAFLPCGLRNAFQQAIFSAFPEYANIDNPKEVIEGNLNYEKNLYIAVDKLSSMDELPEIFFSSDLNSLYHKWFRAG